MELTGIEIYNKNGEVVISADRFSATRTLGEFTTSSRKGTMNFGNYVYSYKKAPWFILKRYTINGVNARPLGYCSPTFKLNFSYDGDKYYYTLSWDIYDPWIKDSDNVVFTIIYGAFYKQF